MLRVCIRITSPRRFNTHPQHMILWRSNGNLDKSKLLLSGLLSKLYEYGDVHVMIICPCDLYTLTSNFYIVRLRLTGVYIIFLFLL